ncbi:MAG: type II secretion system protein, partial [Deltaproteobacteria bacterium]|nr:type II secretion system protein [Deltaproteobacteria bacterium]
KQSGFTILETIMVIMIGSVMAVMVVQFVNTSATPSVTPVTWMNTEYRLQEVMEQITSEYRKAVAQARADNVDFSLDTFLTALKADTRFTGFISEPNTGYISFTSTGGKEFQASAVGANPGDNPVLLITLRQEDQQLRSLFTAQGT